MTASSGCVFKDLEIPCRFAVCGTCGVDLPGELKKVMDTLKQLRESQGRPVHDPE